MSINTQILIGGAKKYPLLVCSAVIALVLLLALYLRSDLLPAQRAELDKYSMEGRRHRRNIANAAQLQDQLNFLIQANNAVKDRALVAGGLAQNLQYFYRLEAEVGIKYLDLRPGARSAAIKGSSYVPLNYIVTIQGDFIQVITFLRHLERGAYFCRINSAVASNSGSVATINLNLDLLGVP
ncbi:MAG: hypothetical protein K0R17_1425 [Rariglobus sp.]|jgi:hypothetical protein|nr:hypothetical protein [Rariglobus sp.]